MNSSIRLLLALAGLAGSAFAQVGTSVVNLQVSRDGVAWSNSLEINPNTQQPRVLVRALISWTSPSSITPLGFASLTWQPVVSGARPTDTIVPFADRGSNTNGGGVTLDGTPLDGPFGRPMPFAATGPAGLNNYLAHFHSNGSGDAPAGTYYRLARNDITRWMGAGPTTGSAAVNNFNGAGGLACVQKSPGNVDPLNDPPFLPGSTDINIFQFAIDVATLAPGEMRDLRIMAPLDGMSRNTSTGLRQSAWFLDAADNFGSLKASISVNEGLIHLVPGPASLSLISIAAFLVGPRRRY